MSVSETRQDQKELEEVWTGEVEEISSLEPNRLLPSHCDKVLMSGSENGPEETGRALMTAREPRGYIGSRGLTDLLHDLQKHPTNVRLPRDSERDRLGFRVLLAHKHPQLPGRVNIVPGGCLHARHGCGCFC